MSDELKTALLPKYSDETETRSMIQTLRTLLFVSLAAGLAALILTLAGNYGLILALPLIALVASAIVCLLLLRRGSLLPAQVLLPTTLYVVVTFIVATGYGLHDIDLLAYAGVIAIAGLTLGQDATLVFGALIVLSIFGIGIGEMQGLLKSPTSSLTNLFSPLNLSVVVLAVAYIQRVLIQRLNESIRRAHTNEQKQIQANHALEDERSNLERRVSERTRDLERRAVQLRAAAEIGNAAASARDLDALLNQAVRLLSTRFGFYHAGIFLLDELGKFAILRASNSEGGQRMLQRGHRLEAGTGIVGYAAKANRGRIALDVGQDAVFFNNPDLPETHSEMALPIKVGGRVLGVLDIQSTQSNAFTNEDVEVLQVVADQLAIAIENSRLLAESRSAAEAARRAYGEASIDAWKRQLETRKELGFISNGREIHRFAPAKEEADPKSLEAISQNRPVTSTDQVRLFAPIVIRGQVVGVLRLVKTDEEHWTENEIQLVQVLSDQLSGALESARLYGDAQTRAAKEHTIEEISARIGSSTNIDSIMQLAAQELGKIMTGSEITIQLEPSRIAADKQTRDSRY